MYTGSEATMVHVCSVKGCQSQERKKQSANFHRFPSNAETRKLWVKFCQQLVNPDTARVCSLHFSGADFKRNLKYELLKIPVPKHLRQLKVGAVPTIYPQVHEDPDPPIIELDNDLEEELVDESAQNDSDPDDDLDDLHADPDFDPARGLDADEKNKRSWFDQVQNCMDSSEDDDTPMFQDTPGVDAAYGPATSGCEDMDMQLLEARVEKEALLTELAERDSIIKSQNEEIVKLKEQLQNVKSQLSARIPSSEIDCVFNKKAAHQWVEEDIRHVLS